MLLFRFTNKTVCFRFSIWLYIFIYTDSVVVVYNVYVDTHRAVLTDWIGSDQIRKAIQVKCDDNKKQTTLSMAIAVAVANEWMNEWKVMTSLNKETTINNMIENHVMIWQCLLVHTHTVFFFISVYMHWNRNQTKVCAFVSIVLCIFAWWEKWHELYRFWTVRCSRDNQSIDKMFPGSFSVFAERNSNFSDSICMLRMCMNVFVHDKEKRKLQMANKMRKWQHHHHLEGKKVWAMHLTGLVHMFSCPLNVYVHFFYFLFLFQCCSGFLRAHWP